jgi:hypothetical protein
MEVVDPAGKACDVLKTHRPHVVLNAQTVQEFHLPQGGRNRVN